GEETEIDNAPDNPNATARRRVSTTLTGPAEISRNRHRFSSVTSSAAKAKTLISSSRISTGSPRRSAVIAWPRALPAPKCEVEMPPRIAAGLVLDLSILPSLPPSIIYRPPSMGAVCLRHQTHPRRTQFGEIDSNMTMSAAHE